MNEENICEFCFGTEVIEPEWGDPILDKPYDCPYCSGELERDNPVIGIEFEFEDEHTDDQRDEWFDSDRTFQQFGIDI